jgi:uncharacterized membrane protein YfcA
VDVHAIVLWAALLGAAFAAGAVNSIAGGGTLFTFPTLLAFGVSPLTANGTSTVALVPGSLSAAYGYRSEMRGDRNMLIALGVPSALGGVAGAVFALRAGDALFARLVPWLILAATVLFIAAEPLSRWARGHAAASEPTGARIAGMMVFQVFVGLYGGFFGAGIGILMLAALGLVGFRNLHRMNGLKNFAAACCNTVASVTFVAHGRVRWDLALGMACAAIVGGALGARVAKRVGQTVVRRAVVVIGFVIAGVMFARQMR